MIVVSDTSCISNLLRINQLNLLQKIFTDIFIPPTVYKEILAFENNQFNLDYFKNQDWIVLEKNFKKNISLSPPKYIDAGEAEAIDLAVHLKADWLLIDERKGTLFATQQGLTTIGLLGLLLIAKQNLLIYSVKDLMDKLVDNNFWISKIIYQKILKEANEQ